jgi:hypothetical protein
MSVIERIDFSGGSEDTVSLIRTCNLCGDVSEIIVDRDKYRLWDAGVLIQDVWTWLTPAERERIKLGYHPECWEKMFNSPEEDDE